MMDFIIAWKTNENGLPLAASQKMNLILKYFHKIKLQSWWRWRKPPSSYLYSTTQWLSLVSGICPISSDRTKNRIEQVEWYVCSVFKLLLCWMEDTAATLSPVISFITCRPPNISPVKGSMSDCISASKTDTENGTYVFSIGATSKQLQNHRQVVRQVGREVGRKKELIQLNNSGQNLAV